MVGCVFGDVSRETSWFVWGGCCGFVGWDRVALVVGCMVLSCLRTVGVSRGTSLLAIFMAGYGDG